MRIYAIGDVHGRVDLLDQVLARIDADIAAHPIPLPMHVFLGDYIDRGPASRQVLDRLVKRCISHHTVCLKGNHESYLCEFLKNPAIFSDWKLNGGLHTVLSYGIKPTMDAGPQEQERLASALDRALPFAHRRLLNSLQPYFICGDFFFVHAGVRPGVPLAEQTEDDMLWIRNEFLAHEESFGKVIVHGHSPVLAPEVHANRINIDTGAYATGKLTCLLIESDEMIFI